MDLLSQLLTSGNQMAHHAYAILTSEDGFPKRLLAFLKDKLGIEHRGNPDVFVQRYELLTIDDARGLKEMHATRPFLEDGRKFFVIEAASITHEAQNALLKMFEEPNDYAHFFLIIPSEEFLLPTLRSRLLMLRDGEAAEQRFGTADARAFLASSPADRIAFVDKLAAAISDEKKPKSAALDFCAGLSLYLRDDGIQTNAAALALLVETESYLRDRSPSVKQLLEYVALSV